MVLERSGHRDQFELVTRWTVEPLDLLRELRYGRAVVRCGGRRNVVAVVMDSALSHAVLVTLGLPCTPATFARQGEFWFDDTG